MKKIIMIACACFVILLGNSVYASCGSCGNSNNSCQSGSCGSSDDSDTCDPYDNPCNCTDPSCGWSWEDSCISRSTCCEAFGNMGAR